MSEEKVGQEAVEETNGGNGKRLNKRQRGAIVLAVLLVCGAVFGVHQWVKSKTHIETDNAFIESHVHSVSSRIPALVKKVAVEDNQFVHKGDVLVELDTSDYQVRARTASAALDVARNETAGDTAQLAGAKATVGLAKARLDQAEIDLKRGEALFAKEVIPRDQLDKLRTARTVAQMQLREAEEGERRAQAALGLTAHGTRDAKVAQKESQLAEANLNLSYTRIVAPSDGFITKKSVEPGNYVQPGQPLMALVSLQDAWVTANYKESQLTDVRPGQKVEFTVDAYPSMHFRGSVESLMAGTGAAFSLLPPENATGNYVKVVQRIPVRIAIDATSDPNHLLRVGMSVVPTILTGKSFREVVGM